MPDVLRLILLCIRLVVVFVALYFIFYNMIGDIKTGITSNEDVLSAVQLAENYLDSNLTSARGVFDATAVMDLNGNPIEMARLCGAASAAEFFVFTGGAKKSLSVIGYGEARQSGQSLEYPIWLKFGEQLVPGSMKLSVMRESIKYPGFIGLSCGVERAWVNKLPQAATTFTCRESCLLYTENDMFCVSRGYRGENAMCRSMPGVAVKDKLIGNGIYNISVMPIEKIEGAIEECDSPNISKGATDTVGKIVLCEIFSGIPTDELVV